MTGIPPLRSRMKRENSCSPASPVAYVYTDVSAAFIQYAALRVCIN